MAKPFRPRGKRDRRPWRRRAVVEQLEPRILLSADLAGEALDGALPPPYDPVDATEIAEAVSMRDSDGVAAEQNASHRELVFLDAGIDDFEMLLHDLLGRGVEVRVLDAERDGVEQIGEILAAYDRNLDTVHLVSHGSDEGVQLGNTWLTLESLPERAESLAAWRGALRGSADLLLYGCDLAGSSEGKALVDALATLTGADVAASTDLTGAAALGGDWDLEYTTGVIESDVPFSTPAQRSWQSVLAYIEDFQTWSPGSSGSWEVVNLSGGAFNVPANAVLEIAISNGDSGASETGGARAFGSSLDRSFALHEADNNSQDFVVMHVQADASSRIETFASDASNIDFTLLGYWDSGTYVETDASFTVAADGAWQDRNLSGFGVTSGSVAEIVIANRDNSEGRDAGVRTNDSTLDRIVRLHDASGGGVDTATLFVQADDTGTARIEAYAEVASDLQFHVVGYWSTAPGTYTEARSAVGSPSVDQSWDSVDLGAFGVPSAGVAEFTVANDQGGASDNDMGVRASGSSLGRTLDLNDRSGGLAGGADLGRMHVVADSSSGIEFYHEDVSDDYNFYLTGYWTMGNQDPTADAGGPYDIAEGDPVTLDASLSKDLDGDSLTYAWDIDGDLAYDDETGISPNLTREQLRDFGIDDDGAHTVSVRVDDGKGGFDTASATINVANTAPTLTVSGPASVDEDDVYTLNLSATDPGDDTIIGWTINWGDGTIDTVSDVPSATHVYTQSGFTRNITVSATDEDGTWTNSDLLVGNYRAGSDEFHRFDGTTGVFESTAPSTNDLNKPYHVIVGPDGDHYASGYNSNNIGRYDSSGNYLGEFVAAGSGGLNKPVGLAFGPDGNLYVASYGSSEVLRFDAAGNFIDVFGVSGGDISGPCGLTFGPDGDLYAASWNNGKVVKYDGRVGGAPTTVIDSGLSNPEQIVFDDDGNLYVSDGGSNAVKRWDGSTLTTYFSDPSLSWVTGLTFGPDGSLYVAGYFSDQVLRYDGVTGEVFVASASGGLDQPEYLSFTPDQQVLVNHRVDIPTVTPAVTEEDTQTSSGLVIDRNTSDGLEVTHFKITNISNGTLYQNDGSTVINDGDFITFAEGNAGLKFTPSLDYFGPASFDVQASTTGDDTVLSTAVIASITVTAVNDAPELDFTVIPVLDSVAEDAGAPVGAVGTLISSLVDLPGAGGLDNVTDVDVGASTGIAVVVANTSNGSWHYSTDGGSTWNPLGAVDWDNARLLAADASTRIYFEPDPDYNGTVWPSFVFRAWDQSAGVNGGTADTSISGGTSAFSIAPGFASIDVTPVDDAPTATDASFALAENSANGTMVGSVSASDVDAGDTLSYAITGGDPGGAFSIDAATGEITVADSTQLDFETTPVFNLTVTVTDAGGLTDTAAVTVSLTNVNEVPTATDAAFALAENSADGTVVGTVSASDVDAGDTLSYAITGGDPGGAFAIDAATGEITVADSTQLDFETTPVFNLAVTVTDAGGLTDTAAVTVSLTNVNEVPTASDAAFVLAENSADGTVVGSVSASDVDAGDTLSYAITGGDPGGAFAIDAATGEITVADSTQLDFETTPVFNLAVTVTDAGGLTDTAAVTVSLTNVNEVPTATDAAFALAENSADGTVVGSVSASDVDAGDTLSYAITGGDPGGAFAIDAATGAITVADSSQLDFETTPVFNLTVTVTDAGGLTDTAAVTVNLTNVNEVPTAADATFALAENSANGTVVGSVSASDVDAGDALSYAITGGDPGGAFAIDAATGAITVADSSQLDFETTPVFNLTVTVTDAGGLTDTAAVTVNLTNVNEVPTAADATFVLAENSANGTVVGSVSASDVDAGDALSYAITGGDPGGAFAIDAATGAITVADSSQLDFETTPVFNLAVTVTDAGGLTDTAAVTVNLTNVNEVPTAADATFALAENSANGTVVGSVSASDVDAGDALSYAITGGDPGGAFAIDAATGAITVADSSQLDFETTPVFNLTVTVTDAGGLTDTAAVTVNLTNVNEVPTAADATFALAENSANGTVVGSVSASDVDAGDALSYAITGGDPGGAFAIDAATGAITVADSSQLDFETTPVFNLAVTVTDAGGLTDTAAVTVNLTNVNEAPTAADATFALAENSANGTVVGSVSASDVDAGDALSYAITGGDPGGAFAIDAATGAITVADSSQLDFETTPVFNLAVTVTDAGGLTDTAAVTVNLTNVNEVPTAADATFALAENSANGTVVGSVSASDVDAGDALSYAITGGDPGGAFAIDAATGEITVADSTQLDFETTPVFNLAVTVTDAGGLTDTAAVTVSLTNVNEVPTASDAAFVLAENSADGTVVGSVSASDVDAGDTLSYAITGGDPGGAFAIDAATGAITVADSSQLDFETTPVFNLAVTVTDAGGLTDTAAVTVNLTNVNEAPTAADATFALAENSANGTVVGSVSASDVDAGDALSYAITGGDPGGAFAIDAATGAITVADSSQLDFETTPVFNLTVTVTDAGGLTDTAAVTVNLTNVNEVPTAADATFALAENSANGTVVGSVSASDVDAGDALSYAITGGDPGGAFAIDAATGAITVADSSQLDFETTPVFNLTVTVTDAGGLTDTAAVTVNLTNVNEVPTAADATFALAENSANGTVVGSVSASDVDAGDALSYAITGGDPGGAFAIDAATGAITVADSSQLDFETTPVFNLAVTVTDAGGLTDTAAVTVNLTNVNEAPTAADATFALAENSANGTVVGSVSASDVDAGDALSYAITGGDPGGAFAIDAATGAITVADSSQLDFETTPVFNLTVTVTDAGGLTDTAAVTVNLTNVNEVPTAADATFALAENSANGTVVGSVSASDVDAGDALSYAITGGDPGGAFAIDAATGAITVADSSQLDFETTPVFNLTVTVTDAGGLTDTAAVTVNLTNVNEVPTAADATFALAENSANGTVVGSVSASDVDAGDALSYAITGGDPGGAFAIDAATGAITVADSSQLDFETTPVFNLAVTVTDAGGLTDTAAVTVNLTNVNEAPTAADATFALAENSANGTVVGSVSASDVDAGDALSYAITGGDPGGAFAIDAATGAITVADSSQLDFETTPVFNLAVTVTDAGGLTDTAAVTVNLTNVNEVPTAADATFALAENSANGTVVGSVSASDVDAGDALSYAITGGDPGGAFAIDAATGAITVADSSQLDFETTPVFNLTVTVTDAGGLTDTAAVTVNLTNVNEAPVLNPAEPTLPSITEDEVDNAGVSVSSLLGSSVTDPDAGAVQGIAITSLAKGNGTWQVQVNGGAWTKAGSVSENHALLLQATDKIRFVPDGRNADAASFTYRAWDQTSGTAGAKVNTSANGGATAFSTATDTASISVIAVNDAPRLGDAVLAAVEEGAADPSGETVVELFAGQVSDVDAGSGFAGIAVVGNGADASTQGVWEYSTDGGASWFAIGSVGDDGTALALSADTLVRFVPAADFDGAPAALVVRGLDDSYAGGFSSSAAGSQTRVSVDTTSSGGISAISGGTATVSTSITAIAPSEPEPEETPVEIAETITDPEEEFVSEADPTSTNETPESPVAETDLPQVSAEPTEPVLLVPPNRVEADSVDLSRQPNVRFDTGSDALSVTRTAIEVFQRIFENEPLIAPGASLTDLIFEQTEFLEELDRLQDEIDSFVGLEMTMAGSSIAVTMGLSIGYVIWLTRGGLLLASLLSSLPAWRLIDPIAVLAHLGTDDEDDRDDGESLDSLLSRSSRPEGSRLWRPEPKRVEVVQSESLVTDADDVPAERDPERRGEK